MNTLSAAPQFLYDEFLYGEVDEFKATLIHSALKKTAFSTPLVPVYGRERTRRRPALRLLSGDVGWLGTLGALFDQIAREQVTCNGSILCALKNVTLFQNMLYVDDGGELATLYEMYRPNDRPATPLAPKVTIDAALNMTVPDQPGRALFYLGSAGSFNYGHWLVDDLPRLKGVEIYAAAVPDRKPTILLPGFGSKIDEVRHDSVKSNPMLSNADVVFLKPDVAYRFDLLHYVTPVSYHPSSKLSAASAYVRQTFEVTRPVGSGTRVFVPRPADSQRSLTNFDEIKPVLDEFGFETVSPETMTFSDQVRCFRGADVVCGVMGAAMTNTIFSPPGAAVVQIACKGWLEPFFWDLANVCDHRYVSVFGDPVSDGHPPYETPFRVDPELLRDGLRLVCGEEVKNAAE